MLLSVKSDGFQLSNITAVSSSTKRILLFQKVYVGNISIITIWASQWQSMPVCCANCDQMQPSCSLLDQFKNCGHQKYGPSWKIPLKIPFNKSFIKDASFPADIHTTIDCKDTSSKFFSPLELQRLYKREIWEVKELFWGGRVIKWWMKILKVEEREDK